MKRKILTSLFAVSLAILACSNVSQACNKKCKEPVRKPEAEVVTSEEVTDEAKEQVDDVEEISPMNYMKYDGVAYSLKDADSYKDVLIDETQIEPSYFMVESETVKLAEGYFRNPSEGEFDGYFVRDKFLIDTMYIYSDKFEFANGIKIGSSLEDVEATFGSPVRYGNNSDGEINRLTYENEDFTIVFEFEESGLTEIRIENKAVKNNSDVQEYMTEIERFFGMLSGDIIN